MGRGGLVVPPWQPQSSRICQAERARPWSWQAETIQHDIPREGWTQTAVLYWKEARPENTEAPKRYTYAASDI